jgi:triosephosphate isomerase
MASKKIAKALIGGNWKCNGTMASVKQMAEVLNKAGPFSANSEVVIAAPSLHLLSLKSILRPDIAVCSEVCGSSFTMLMRAHVLTCL